MTNIDLAYIAGIVDGEGYVGIKKIKPYNKLTGRVNPGYSERIQIRMVDEEAIKFIANILGGWYYKEKPHSTNGQPLFCYQISDISAIKILQILYPYLKIKKKQADVLFQLRKRKDNPDKILIPIEMKSRWGKRQMFRRIRFSEKEVAERDKLWQQCRKLNGDKNK